jgi:capsular exopolysaccharide synthesis family protein
LCGAGAPSAKSFLVTSAQAGEGKTSLAVSLSISLAEVGSRVLLIDGDVQVPRIGDLFKITPRGDLADVMLGRKDLEGSVTSSAVPGLHVLVGHANGVGGHGLLNGPSVAKLVREAAALYDYVVIDSPPALGAADALMWAQAVDTVILACLLGHSDTNAIRLVRERLNSIGAKMAGAVIANVSIHERYYSYSTSGGTGVDNGTGASAKGTRLMPLLVHFPGASGGASGSS